MAFKKGDEVFVWDIYRKNGKEAIYIAYDNFSNCGATSKHIAADCNSCSVDRWKNCEPRRPDLKVDDPIVVWNVEGAEHNRHFARWGEDGRIIAFTNGTTSWSDDFGTTEWDHYRLPTKDELKK